MKEKYEEAEEILSELELPQEQLEAREAALPRAGVERLEMAEGLREVLQSETHQLKENMREMTAMVSFILSPICFFFLNYFISRYFL